MTAPTTFPDFATVAGQTNPNGPTQVSVYDGTTADPAISARTLATLEPGELPVVGARRVDHANATDYGFGADGIEYLLTTAGGALIPDVAGLSMIDVLANDLDGDTTILRSSLAIATPPTHGAAVALGGLIWYAPHAGYEDDVDTLEYEVDNSSAETSDPALLTLQVTVLGEGVLLPSTVSVSRGYTFTIDPQESVSGVPTPIVLAVEITTPPVQGEAEVVGRKVSYTAAADFSGVDTFAWRVLLNGVWSEPAEVRLRTGQAVRRPGQVKGFLRFPSGDAGMAHIVAVADETSTTYGTPVNIPVLANDIGANLSVDRVQTTISGGAAVVEVDNTITFTPDVNFSGLCTFKYVITDGQRSAAGLVSVNVGAPPVVALDDALSTTLTDPVNVPVLANDVGTGLTVVAVGTPDNGSAVINVDEESIDYTADAGFTGYDYFGYTIEDENGAQSMATVTVLVLAAAFTVQNDSANTPQGQAVEIDVLANDVGTGLEVTAVDQGTNGAVTITSAGAKVTYNPASLFTGEDSFRYTVTDAYGQVLTARCFVVVTAVGSAPSALGDSVTTLGQTPVEINVLANDLGAGISISGLTQPAAGRGVAALSSSGTKITYTAPPNFSGTVTFTYTIANPYGSSTATISVEVTRPEMILAADSATVANDDTVDITPLTNDVGTGLAVTAVGAVAPASAGSRTRVGNTITFTPSPTFTGSATMTYTVTDSYGFQGSSSISVVVTAPPAAAYANGYEALIQRYVGPDTEAMSSFPVLLDITDPKLRLVANGGVVREQFHDVRCEDGAGNKLSHGIFSHDVVNGRAVLIVKRSRSASAWNSIQVYCGKQGSVVDEQDWPGATAGHLAYWRMDTGVDLTGNARHLTPAAGTVTTLFGQPAYDCNGATSKLELANPSGWLNGASAITLLMDLQHDQIANDQGFFRVGGTFNGTDVGCAMMARSDASLLADPTKSALYFAKQDTSIAAVTTNCPVNGEASRIFVGRPSCFAYAWASGEAQDFTSDDLAETEITKTVATPTGTLVVPGGPLAFGYGPRAPFNGIIGTTRIASTRRSQAWIKAEQRNRIRPLLMLAGAVAKLPGDTTPPVAYPDTATAPGLAAFITISPLANDTGTGLTLVSCSADVGTAVVQTSSTIRYTQGSAPAGTAYITYTIRDTLGRQSTSIIAVAVTPPAAAAAPDSYTVTVSTTTDLDVLANDTPTGGVEVDAITVAPAAGSATPLADKSKVRFVAPATPGALSFSYRNKLIGGASTATAAVSVSVQAVSSIPTNFYDPPHRPLVESDIVVWNYGGPRPANNWAKYCLLVWPDTPLTGSGVTWNISDAEWAGMFEIGWRYHPIGNSIKYRTSGSGSPTNPYTQRLPGLAGIGGMLQRSFNNNAPGTLKVPGKRPFWWCDGGVIDTCSRTGDAPGIQQSCWWGDFWKTGINRSTDLNYPNWASDAYVMRTRIDNSCYFFSEYVSPTADGQACHSDWMQNEALCARRIMFWRFFGKVHGQGIYLTGDQSTFADGTPKGIIPSDAFLELSYFHGQPMPYDDATLFAGGKDTKYLALAQIRSTNASDATLTYPGGYSVPPGRYYAAGVGPECYFQRKLGTLENLSPLLGKPYGYNGGVSISGNRIAYGYDERCFVADPQQHSYPVAGMTSGGPFARSAGFFRDASILAPASAMVPDSYCGLPRQITTAADLLSYLDNHI